MILSFYVFWEGDRPRSEGSRYTHPGVKLPPDGTVRHVDEVLERVRVRLGEDARVQPGDHEQHVDVHGHGSVIVEILSPALGALEVQVARRRVRVDHPLVHLHALALVVLSAVVELLVDGAQELVDSKSVVMRSHEEKASRWPCKNGWMDGSIDRSM